MEKYYSIHDILTFKVVSKSSLMHNPINQDIELRGFESDSIDNPDFTIFIGKFMPRNKDCIILDNNYYIKENYFYCQDYCKYGRWQIEISNFGRKDTVVRIHPNLLGNMFITELLIHPMIWFKLNEMGCPIIHASAVTKNNYAYVFAGQGASGKSTIALNLMEKGFGLLSEHFIFLNDGKLFSFPTPFHLMDFNILPIIKRNMCFRHKIIFQFKQLFHHITGRRIATKILPDDIFPNSLVRKAQIHSMFLLLPKKRLKIEKLEKDKLIEHLSINQKLESLPFIKYMVEYSYIFPDSEVAAYWDRYNENLRKNLGDEITSYCVETPQKYEVKTVEEIYRLIQQ